MAHHELKIEDCFWDAKVEGLKPFEIRFNGDRGFQKGDTVQYMTANGIAPRQGLHEITYVTAFQQKEGFVVFGDKPIAQKVEKTNDQ